MNKTPTKVKMLVTVSSDIPFVTCIAGKGEEYNVSVNKNGAVTALIPGGGELGLKPGEFEVTEWK